MVCGINCALANRQVITHLVRECFDEVFPGVNLRLLYDVSHNTCKIEIHEIEGQKKKIICTQKRGNKAYPPYSPEIPLKYQEVGQPVIIGGTMGTSSYILAGNKDQEDPAFFLCVPWSRKGNEQETGNQEVERKRRDKCFGI